MQSTHTSKSNLMLDMCPERKGHRLYGVEGRRTQLLDPLLAPSSILKFLVRIPLIKVIKTKQNDILET